MSQLLRRSIKVLIQGRSGLGRGRVRGRPGLGSRLGVVQESFGSRSGVVGESLGSCSGVVWELFGTRLSRGRKPTPQANLPLPSSQNAKIFGCPDGRTSERTSERPDPPPSGFAAAASP